MNLSKLIRLKRIEKGLTQKQLGYKLNYSPSYVSKIENTKETRRALSLKKIIDISILLDIDPRLFIYENTFKN